MATFLHQVVAANGKGRGEIAQEKKILFNKTDKLIKF